MESPRILDLSNAVAVNTVKYHEYLVANGHALPSHNPAVPLVAQDLPTDIIAARDKAIQASYDLHELLIGPFNLVINTLYQV